MSNDAPYNLPATLAAAPETAHCAYDFAQVDVFAEASSRRQRPRHLHRRTRPLDRRDAGASPARPTSARPPSSSLAPPEIERERGVQVRIFTVHGRAPLRRPSHAWHRKLALLPTIQSCAAQRQSRSTSGIGPIPVRFTPPQPWRTRRLRHDAAERSHLRRDSQQHAGSRDSQRPSTSPSTISIPTFPYRPSPPAWPSASCRCARWRSPRVSRFRCMSLAPILIASTQNSSTASLAPHPTAGADWHARMQFYNGEDPATGSASGCTIAYLVRHGLAASGQPIVIEQGIEMLRPSRIHVQATLAQRRRHKCVRRWPHHSRCKRTLFPAVMHPISTGAASSITNNSCAFHITVDAQALISTHLRS